MIRQLKRLLPYLLIIITGILVRFVYWRYVPGVVVSEDTYSYYQVGQVMLGEFFFANQYRAPVYSILLAFMVNTLGEANAAIFSGPFMTSVFYVIYLQMVIGILGLVILYRTLKILKLNFLHSLYFVLFIGTNIVIFSWERLLLTESLAVFCLTLFFYLTVKILDNARYIFFVLFLMLSVFTLMLRPFNIGLPVIPLFIAVLFHRKRRVTVFALMVLVLYFCFIRIYSTYNFKRWGYLGVSRAGDLNLLGKILEFRLPVSAGQSEQYIYNLVVNYQSRERDPHPFRFLEYYNLLAVSDIPKLLPLKNFNRKVIMANFPTYLLKSAAHLPGAITEVSEKLIILPVNQSFASLVFNLNLMASRRLQLLFYLIFIFFPASLFQFLKARTILNSALVLAAGMSLYQIIFSVFIAHGEYGRLIIPAQPIMYFFCFYYLNKIFDRARAVIRLRIKS